jgi:hypothetical protein
MALVILRSVSYWPLMRLCSHCLRSSIFYGPYHINPYCSCFHIAYGLWWYTVRIVVTSIAVVFTLLTVVDILRSLTYWPLMRLSRISNGLSYSTVRIILTATAVVFTLLTVLVIFRSLSYWPLCGCVHIAYGLRYSSFRVIVTPTPFYGERLA